MTKENSKGMKIIRASAENFKNLDKTIIEINGQSLLVMGKNGSGKSSFLQMLLSPLTSKVIPTQPIKEGEERATVSVTIAGEINGEPREYICDLYFTPANQRGRLKITNAQGEDVKSPATVMKTILGNITFDVFQFLNSEKKEQIKTLKELTGKKVEIDNAEVLIAAKFKEKGELDTKIKLMESMVGKHGFTDEQIELYSSPKDIEIAAINAQMADVDTAIANYTKVEQGVKDMVEENKRITEDNNKALSSIAEAEKQIAELQQKITKLNEGIATGNTKKTQNEEKIVKGNKWLSERTKPSLQELSSQLQAFNEHNKNHEKVKEIEKSSLALIEEKKNLDTILEQIKTMKADRDKIITSSKLPVKGLSFTDDEITLNGLPFDESNINTAKLHEVGFAIAKALNPNLRVILIKEGSMFDKENLRKVMNQLIEEGYQVFAEVVTEDDTLELKFVETKI